MIKETLKQDLKSLICEGNIAKLPTDHLNDYSTLKTVLIKACGKYKNNSFEFPYPAKVIINKLLTGENINFKKEFQFFATPKEGVNEALNNLIGGFECEYLEPSAGHGAFIDGILEYRPCAKITAYELSELNYEVLKEKYKDEKRVSIIQGDFLKVESTKKYDVVIGNPPFSNNQDIDHIMHMKDFVKDNGQMICYSSNSWRTGSQKKQQEFRQFAEENFMYYDIDRGLFKESGTMVATTLITY